MTVVGIVFAVLFFVIAGLFLLFGIRSFTERGFLLNNAYIYATKEERETMDKKPYYRQSAIVFCILSIVFVIIGLTVLFRNGYIGLLIIPLAAAAIIFAVVSSVRNNKK